MDALIITALPVEYEAARSAANGVPAGRWREQSVDDHTPYLLGEYQDLTVALARPTDMGGRKTGTFVTTLTNHLRPACLAMCGVCAGNPGDTAPGDVIVAAPAYEWDEGMQAAGAFQGAHQQYPLNDRWLRAVQDFEPVGLPSYGSATEDEATIWFLERLHRGQDAREHPARPRYFPRGTWSQRLSPLEADGLIAWTDSGWTLTQAGAAMIGRRLDDEVDGPDRLPFAVLSGPMASGSAVVQDGEIWPRLKNMGARKILAVEMEAATIATVAHDREVAYWLVAKGVMDHADPQKDDRFKEFAARASAEVLFALLGRLLPGRSETPPPASPGARTPGAVKVEFCRRLAYDWQDLADLVGVPAFERFRFRHGDEPRAIWEWLEARGRLAELPAALADLGRADLVELIRPYLRD